MCGGKTVPHVRGRSVGATPSDTGRGGSTPRESGSVVVGETPVRPLGVPGEGPLRSRRRMSGPLRVSSREGRDWGTGYRSSNEGPPTDLRCWPSSRRYWTTSCVSIPAQRGGGGWKGISGEGPVQGRPPTDSVTGSGPDWGTLPPNLKVGSTDVCTGDRGPDWGVSTPVDGRATVPPRRDSGKGSGGSVSCVPSEREDEGPSASGLGTNGGGVTHTEPHTVNPPTDPLHYRPAPLH